MTDLRHSRSHSHLLPILPILPLLPVLLVQRLIALLVVLTAIGASIGPTATIAHAADTCSPSTCVLACNVHQKICSRFPNTQVPAGYVRVSFMPYGYRRVRQSKCDLMVCPSYVKDCRRWVPTHHMK